MSDNIGHLSVDKNPCIENFNKLLIRYYGMGNFRSNVMKGHIAKEMVRGLLEDSGYKAYAYGYESLLSQIRYDIQKKRPPQTDSIKRLRSTPDLLVYDEYTAQTWYTEVKFRRVDNPHEVELKAELLAWYQKYWNDSVIVVVIPVAKCFYAQYVNKFEEFTSSSKDEVLMLNLNKEFLPVHDIFPRIKIETIGDYVELFEEFPTMDTDREDLDFS